MKEIKPDGKYIFSCYWEDIDKAIEKLHDLREKYGDDDSEEQSRKRSYRKNHGSKEKPPGNICCASTEKAQDHSKCRESNC